MSTFMDKPGATPPNPKWYVVDAQGQILGRLASRIAAVLRGKARATYTPHVGGDYVIVVNADKIRVTGRKLQQKVYYRHSGYPGSLTEITLGKLLARRPEEVLKAAVKGMLPNSPLGRACFRRLRVYRGPTHPHVAQQPVPLDLTGHLRKGA